MIKDARKQIEAWVEANPNGYLEKSMAEICKEMGLSATLVDWHLHEIIADRDNCLPSEALAKRKEAGFRVGQGISTEAIAEIRRLHYEEGLSQRDIVYITKISPPTVKKYLK